MIRVSVRPSHSFTDGWTVRTEEVRPMELHLFNSYRFFERQADSVVGRHAAGALALAKAEAKAQSLGLEYEWAEDPDADLSWMDAKERDEDHEVFGCILWRPCPEHGIDCKHAEHLASLWGIVDPDSAYRRVIEAELAIEALT